MEDLSAQLGSNLDVNGFDLGVSGDTDLLSLETNAMEVRGLVSLSGVFTASIAGSHSFTGDLAVSDEFLPDADNGAVLGATNLQWSDLFLASGAVINFNTSDVTITHSSNTLTVGGGALVVSLSASHSFTGDLTISDDLVVSGELILPNASGGPTVVTSGSCGIDTASSSFNCFDGTAERVLPLSQCFTYVFEDPTITENFGQIPFRDAVTIFEVSAFSSGANSVGWNLKHGVAGTLTTDLFTADKSASGSALSIYTSFNDATLADRELIELEIASASATIENLNVQVCYRVDA